MISTKTLVRLGLSVETGCPTRWHPDQHYAVRCVATGATHACVGDVGHGGKHVCPCGALRDVA